MKKPALLCLLICFFITPGPTKAQNLRGLTGVKILVEELTDESKSLGLTSQSVRDHVLVALKRDIPKLKVSDTLSPYVYVRITSLIFGVNNDFVASNIEVHLKRPVLIGETPDLIAVKATVWDKEALMTDSTTNMASRINNEISNILTMFAADYYKDNP